MWFYIRIRPCIFDFWVLIFLFGKFWIFFGYWIWYWSKKSFFLKMQRLPISYNWISETFHILFHGIFGLEVVFFPNLEIFVKIAHYKYLHRIYRVMSNLLCYSSYRLRSNCNLQEIDLAPVQTFEMFKLANKCRF